MKTVLVCGGRDFGDEQKLFEVMDKLTARGGIAHPVGKIIHGGAQGADTMAGRWAKDRDGVEVWVFRANWTKHGPAAGPIRNQQMLDWGKPDIVIAFPGGAGTADMLQRAKKLDNLMVIQVRLSRP